MLYQYRSPSRDLENVPFSDVDEQRVDLAIGTFTQLQSLRAVPLGTSFPIDNGSKTYTHLLPRDASEELLSRLEYSWKIPWGTLNVDTRSNILCLSPEMRAFFDQGHWIIAPEKRISDRYLQHPGEIINEPFYKYTIMVADPHPEFSNPMRDVSIYDMSDYASSVEKSAYPFNSLPTIISHVHPRFVICCYGDLVHTCIRHLLNYSMRANLPQRPIVNAMIHVFQAWIKGIPFQSRFFCSPCLTDDRPKSVSSQQSVKTVPRRLHPKPFKRAQKNYKDRIASRRSRHKPQSTCGDGLRLERKNLRALEEGEAPSIWRKRFLEGWIIKVSEEALVPVEDPELPDDVRLAIS